jgi:outer membrane protein OmpA-like peptidoglycan-associated protein
LWLKELVSKYGVVPDRLKAGGVGPLAPVASNNTEEGKAKNRRVELVKQ